MGLGRQMEAITSLMYENSTLIGSIILVGALAYIGTNAISPDNIALRRLMGYLTATILVLIGAFSLYFGASKELMLIYAHVYQFDVFRLEWTFVGVVAIIAGLLLARQSLRRM